MHDESEIEYRPKDLAVHYEVLCKPKPLITIFWLIEAAMTNAIHYFVIERTNNVSNITCNEFLINIFTWCPIHMHFWINETPLESTAWPHYALAILICQIDVLLRLLCLCSTYNWLEWLFAIHDWLYIQCSQCVRYVVATSKRATAMNELMAKHMVIFPCKSLHSSCLWSVSVIVAISVFLSIYFSIPFLASFLAYISTNIDHTS